ncbi:hypothetical protein TrST_g6587 [Triparma strigata]|uniref:PCI domain-containing protein n=1 Tax=Triparma strigata TaxID=1606541 RepID=A0A9W7EW83_9STRA|nr:hypothetical protein TrST_g6587 [Triparma strigata]
MEIDAGKVEVVSSTALLDDGDQEDDSADLVESLEAGEDSSKNDVQTRMKILTEIVQEPDRFSIYCTRAKESAVYALSRCLCEASQYSSILPFVTETCKTFFSNVTKAKTAKIVRQVLDIVSVEAPKELVMLENVCGAVINWCTEMNRTFLRQRVESKLAYVYYEQEKYSEALELISRLLTELKKLDDKALLVECHLTESKIHHGLRNLPKAKAALTASRTCANAIYVGPALQSNIDQMSGVLHTEEKDYNTAHSYFLEAFEQLDQMNDQEKAVPCLKYMMLCRILDGLNKALKLSAKGVSGAKSSKAEADLSGLVTGKQGVKYAGKDIEAMTAIAAAASKRNLKEFQATTDKYSTELKSDLLINHHIHILYEQLLESNLLRIIEPFSCVEISHVASLIEMPVTVVERKLSTMILDGKLNAILNQGEGQLIVHEAKDEDKCMGKGLEVIKNMGKVVDNLYARSNRELVMR